MSDEELYAIGNIIKYLPIFNDYGRNRLTGTAYALACDVAAADSHVS